MVPIFWGLNSKVVLPAEFTYKIIEYYPAIRNYILCKAKV